MKAEHTAYGLDFPPVGERYARLDEAIRLMRDNPSLIKRPVVEHDSELLVGFDAATWAGVLG